MLMPMRYSRFNVFFVAIAIAISVLRVPFILPYGNVTVCDSMFSVVYVCLCVISATDNPQHTADNTAHLRSIYESIYFAREIR